MFIVPCLKDKDHTFTQVRKSFIFDSRLRMKTRFLLIFLISKPPSWCFNYPEILKSCPEGIYSIRSSIRQLIKFGYISHKQDRLPNKRFSYSHYMISETPVFFTPIKTALPPHVDFPHTGFPHTGFPHTGSRLPDKDKIRNKEIKETTTKPTKVVITKAPVDVSLLKKNKERILELFVSLGIFNHNIILAKYNNSDILKYVSWMNSAKPKFDNATAFLISAIKEKWDISGSSVDTSSSSGHFKYECRKCHVSHNYSFGILDYKFCKKCTEGKY